MTGFAALARKDAGLQAAIAAAGGDRKLARLLGLKNPGTPWARVPQDRVFQVAGATGVDPKTLRPDLADWIDQETWRRELAASTGGANLGQLGAGVGAARWDGPTVEGGLVDLWSSLAAAQFVARLRGLTPRALYSGVARHEQAARAYAMALAKVVGRAQSANIAGVFQCSRQNVDNATTRYLRARDGDEPDEYITGQFPDGIPRVFETGSNRLRRAKAAVDGLWDVEVQFESFLTGEDLTLPAHPQRRRG